MQRLSRSVFRIVLLGSFGVGACSPAASVPIGLPPPEVPPAEVAPPAIVEGLPPIPPLEGPLSISLVHPTPGTMRPGSESVLIYGSVGSGRATLTINGSPVEVHPNGAFLGFLPRPVDDVLRFRATDGSNNVEAEFAYRLPPAPSPAGRTPVTTITYASEQFARVTGGADTVATGSEAAIGRPSPTGTYRWFLPNSARVVLTGERGDMVRARLDSSTEAWFPRGVLTVEGSLPPPATVGEPRVVGGNGWTDVYLPANGAPFQVQVTDSLLEVTLHGVNPTYQRVEPNDGVVALVEIHPTQPDAATMRIYPEESVWGYKAFYDSDGSIVLRVRPPPRILSTQPLRGIRIVVDPGHPPGGAPGPTGLAEAEANLAVGSRLGELLRARGAEVLMTRTTDGAVGLTDRVDMAVEWRADILVSVHNNAFPEGANPYQRHGTSSYYFHPLSEDLARVMNEEIVATTRIRDLGPIQGNLALVRPTWMPSVLTESLFMPIPEQEAALRDPQFLDRLAEAHVRGLERFLMQKAGM